MERTLRRTMVDKKLKNIKVIVWDIDGTLYQSIPEVSLKIKSAFWERLAGIKGLSIKAAEKLGQQEAKKWGSLTTTLVVRGCGTPVEILTEIENKVDKASFLTSNPKLVKTFEKLSKFRHITLSNSLKKTTEKTLKVLGVDRFFERIISVEDRGTVKPDLASFKQVLSYTRLSPSCHLSIGDREKVDIIPAKKLGMKTCLVWGKSDIADVSIPTVYDIVKVLL